MRPIYYCTPDWPDNPGLIHGMLEPFRFTAKKGWPGDYQHTLCGRSILNWWREADPLGRDRARRVCKHCGPAILHFMWDGLPSPPEQTGQMKLPLQPPRPDVAHV